MLRASLAEILPADRFITGFSVPASKPAALVAEKFHFRLFPSAQRIQLPKRLIQPKIRYDIPEFFPLDLLFELRKRRQHFGRRGHQIQLVIFSFQICKQQFRMDDNAVLRSAALGKHPAKRVAPSVRKMFFPEQGIAERQSRRYSVFPRQRQNVPRPLFAKTGAPAAPDAVRRRAVNRANLAPVVKVLPVFAP